MRVNGFNFVNSANEKLSRSREAAIGFSDGLAIFIRINHDKFAPNLLAKYQQEQILLCQSYSLQH